MTAGPLPPPAFLGNRTTAWSPVPCTQSDLSCEPTLPPRRRHLEQCDLLGLYLKISSPWLIMPLEMHHGCHPVCDCHRGVDRERPGHRNGPGSPLKIHLRSAQALLLFQMINHRLLPCTASPPAPLSPPGSHHSNLVSVMAIWASLRRALRRAASTPCAEPAKARVGYVSTPKAMTPLLPEVRNPQPGDQSWSCWRSQNMEADGGPNPTLYSAISIPGQLDGGKRQARRGGGWWGSGDERTRKTGRGKGTGGMGGQGDKTMGRGDRRTGGAGGQGVGDKGTGGQEECGVQPTLASLSQLLG